MTLIDKFSVSARNCQLINNAVGGRTTSRVVGQVRLIRDGLQKAIQMSLELINLFVNEIFLH